MLFAIIRCLELKIWLFTCLEKGQENLNSRHLCITKILKTFLFSYVDSTRRLAVNLAGGGGGDLKNLMAEHSLIVNENTSNSGISLDIVYLKQAEHLMRSDNYKTAIKYTHKALEINPELTVRTTYLTLKDTGGSKSARWSGDCLTFLSGSCYGHKNS